MGNLAGEGGGKEGRRESLAFEAQDIFCCRASRGIESLSLHTMPCVLKGGAERSCGKGSWRGGEVLPG